MPDTGVRPQNEAPLNESDTRSKLIDPAIHARGWTEDLIRREETAGAIEMVAGRPRRQARGRIDYTLRVKVNPDTQPVALAVLEAKAETLPPHHGLEQAKAYAMCQRLNVPFVFSSNGHLFVEFDRFTGTTSAPRPLNQFPSPADLRARYEHHMGFSLEDDAAKPLSVKYVRGEATRRYYQDAAIRAVLEKIARCEHSAEPKRALLSLATGAGKTFIAVNLLRRIADAGQLRRALFVCDRDELRTQAAAEFQNYFGSDAAMVTGSNPQKNARILIATYQTLDIDKEEATANFLTANYPEDYFSHIIIDECHRSAWGKWSQVLTRNPHAVEIGLTATPRQLEVQEDSAEAQADKKITADNLAYFGEPVYVYDMAQGIEDGYLALCEIQRGRVNLDNTGISLADIMARNPVDSKTGRPVSAEELRQWYEKTSFENRVLLPDRVLAMCGDLFDYLLKSGGPEQKTIIFCVSDDHADRVAAQMNNLYAAWCKSGDSHHHRAEPYAFKCTAKSGGGDMVADLRGASGSYFIATTVELLTTGVDVPWVRNIVFFKYVNSPIAFYQMVGRGTRLHPASGKLSFVVYDYTNATRLFGEDFRTKATKDKPDRATGGGTEQPPPKPPETTIVVEGFDVTVSDEGRYIVTQVDGRAMPVTVEEYKERLAAKLVQEAPDLTTFRSRWIHPAMRRELLGKMPDSGRSPMIVQQMEHMDDYDLYDLLAELGYGAAPRTRAGRAEAFVYKNDQWLKTLPNPTAETIKAVAAQFRKGGTPELESTMIFQTPEVVRAGGLDALRQHGTPSEILIETKERMFSA